MVCESFPPMGAAARELTGAWRRRTLSTGGLVGFEDSDCLWLQAGDIFADLRTPCARQQQARGSPAAFSGRVEWLASRITFHRDIDLAPPSQQDSALLRWEAGRLVECGVFRDGEREIPYEEVWVRESSGGPWRVFEGRLRHESAGTVSMRMVEIADVAIALVDERSQGGGFGAAHLVRESGAWCLRRQVGDLHIGPPPPWVDAGGTGQSVKLPQRHAGEDLPHEADDVWTNRLWTQR